MKPDTLKLINDKIADMIRYFPNIIFAPFKAQLGLLDMSYNVGAQGVVKKFNLFSIAVRTCDWNLAIIESHRAKPISETRNKIVASWFLAAQTEQYISELKGISPVTEEVLLTKFGVPNPPLSNLLFKTFYLPGKPHSPIVGASEIHRGKK